MNALEILVFKPDFEPLGPINQFTALRWTERFNDFGDFTLWCPLTPENAQFLKQENLLWIGTEAMGIIEVIQLTHEEDGALGLQVSGRFNDCWLERRIVWDRYNETDYISNHMRQVVKANIVNPTIATRKIPHTALLSGTGVQGPSIKWGAHRDNLWLSIRDLGAVYTLFPHFVNVPSEGTAYFTVTGRTDRSIEQTKVPAITLSTELSDILKSDYMSDFTSWKNCARIAGAGEGSARKETTINAALSGLDRRELSVDARDISDTEPWNMEKTITTKLFSIRETGVSDNGLYEISWREWYVRTTQVKVLTHPVTGETRTTTEILSEKRISDEEKDEFTPTTDIETGTEDVPFPNSVYAGMLAERGKAYLSENVKVEAFNTQIRMHGTRAYTYGEDYFLGDRITIQDLDLQIQISTDVTEVEQTWDADGHSVYLTLGAAAPTIKQLVKKRG